jgi:hypothetical protein
VEAISKIIELIKQLLPMFIGWFSAKQDSKIEKLESENETLKEYDKIDNTVVDDVYNTGMFK